MSGHSKWAQIKRQKGTADIKRGQAFTKLANAITIAVRQGGGIADPDANFRLRLAIEKARQSNMPKENIERAIRRASGKEGGDLEEAVYEGYGPGKVAVMVEVATDNKQRTAGEIRNIFDREGGVLGSKGSVSYLFESVGQISVPKKEKNADDIMLVAIDSGAQDVEETTETVEIYTKPEDLNRVKEAVKEKGLDVSSAELEMKPQTTVAVTDPQMAQKILAFIEKLENLDDVQRVFANFDIPDELLS
ncbi:YebC/PmpR family DNA-binding transcriptional regulator [Candidatus Microgenomates bacterium]|nr:YebC/PmpR family DNA-binding transcriptional regulator [Candidatus Microgenomates bacterium]